MTYTYISHTGRKILGILIFLMFCIPFTSHGAAPEIAGWIPWWQVEEGTESAEDHIRDLDTTYPFVFEVDDDGSLIEKTDLNEREWRNLFRQAERRNVEVIPTIFWGNGEAIHSVLSDRKLRRAHVRDIARMVDDGGFDGVDIDYESKLAETKDYFSLFLKELNDALGRDILTCTVEARTPPESKYREVPRDLEYANDYREMNRYCDRIEIMAYDQQRIDWKLNSEKKGEPYMPVADTDWVEKVIDVALEDFDADKIMLGAPTYGREWELTVAPEWFKEYRSQGAINMPLALEIAEEYNVEPGRNKAGEMSFSYFPEDSVFSLLNQLPTPEGTRKGFEAAAKALLFANATGMEVPVNIVWYSDARAIEDKLDLVKKYNLRGLALFKIDGEEDEDIWDLF